MELSPVYAQRDATFIEVKTGEKGTESDVFVADFSVEGRMWKYGKLGGFV